MLQKHSYYINSIMCGCMDLAPQKKPLTICPASISLWKLTLRGQICFPKNSYLIACALHALLAQKLIKMKLYRLILKSETNSIKFVHGFRSLLLFFFVFCLLLLFFCCFVAAIPMDKCVFTIISTIPHHLRKYLQSWSELAQNSLKNWKNQNFDLNSCEV